MGYKVNYFFRWALMACYFLITSTTAKAFLPLALPSLYYAVYNTLTLNDIGKNHMPIMIITNVAILPGESNRPVLKQKGNVYNVDKYKPGLAWRFFNYFLKLMVR